MASLWKCFLQEDHCATRRIIFTYPMIAYTDLEDSVRTEVMEIATNACEKYLNDNQSVSFTRANLKWLILTYLGCSDDQRGSWQEVWDNLACCGGWRIWVWHQLWDHQDILHVLCWQSWSLCMEMLQLLNNNKTKFGIFPFPIVWVNLLLNNYQVGKYLGSCKMRIPLVAYYKTQRFMKFIKV